MALDLRLQQKMSQQLVMTPQLQQAIKLLQLSHLELADVLQKELEENPVLEERADSSDDGSDVIASESADARDPAESHSDDFEPSMTDLMGGNDGDRDAIPAFSQRQNAVRAHQLAGVLHAQFGVHRNDSLRFLLGQ